MPQLQPPFADAPPPALTGDVSLPAELTIIIVSYNTRGLTLKCLETLFAATHEARAHVVVYDNASTDGSAEAVAEAFPQVELIASPDNHGFARANNIVAEAARTEWLLLLNPDTEVHEGAIDALLTFARARPGAGITGGRTVFPDGALNIASCWMRITPWSAFCMATGLTAAFRGSALFNPEGMGAWQRDSVRDVDIVVGCFLMIRRDLWDELGGFDLKYFMYGEEADLCLRAARLGYQPAITPEAQIMHLVGAASGGGIRKMLLLAKARVTLMRDHWPRALVPLGLGLMLLWAALRYAGALARQAMRPGPAASERSAMWREVWQRRREWLAGYVSGEPAGD